MELAGVAELGEGKAVDQSFVVEGLEVLLGLGLVAGHKAKQD